MEGTDSSGKDNCVTPHKIRKMDPQGQGQGQQGQGQGKGSGARITVAAAASASWQESKGSIKERTSCLVNSERLSDITFLVGEREAPIYGHKTILSAGSPYFERLFFGPMAIKENVHKVLDLEPSVFMGFLKYLYTDEFDEGMDAEEAMLLLKPAKIYIVPHLANKCADLLIDKMNPENVFLIYNRAIVFDEPRLADVCLRYLDRQVDKVVLTEEFLDIELETLCTMLSRENLRINECVLFKAVIKWSEAECKRKDLPVNPTNQREVLGRAINLIRFPAMSKEEFAIEVVPTDILTKDEIIAIFMNLCIGPGTEHKNIRRETPFIAERRIYRPKLHYLTRFADVLSKVIHFSLLCGGDNVYNSSVKFRVDQRVFINGVGIYAISSSITGLKFNATVSLFKSRSVPSIAPQSNPLSSSSEPIPASSVTFAFGQLLGSRSMEGTSRNYDFRMPFQVMFERPLEVRPDEEYNINAILKVVKEPPLSAGFGAQSPFPFGAPGAGGFGSSYGNQIDGYYGTKSLSNVYVGCTDGIKVNFTFPNVTPAETFSTGQIPQIIFSV